ncbi:MAG: hypothetical protein WCE63_00320 [Acidobacteriaceae bacterium]
MKNPEDVGVADAALILWILRFAQNDAYDLDCEIRKSRFIKKAHTTTEAPPWRSFCCLFSQISGLNDAVSLTAVCGLAARTYAATRL